MAWPLLYVAGVNVVESTWQSRVQGLVEELADGLAAGQDSRIRQRIRVLADGLLREMLRAVCGASARDIADAISALEATRAERAAVQRAVARAGSSARLERAQTLLARTVRSTQAGEGPERREYDTTMRTDSSSPPSPHAHDPFDITMPSELLASTDEVTPKSVGPNAAREVGAPPQRREPRLLPKVLSAPIPSPVVGTTEDAEAESERRPKVVLREGERLLKGTGSGIVIRRERRVKP